jgi:lysophospholipase L1-like esterase
MKIKIVSLSLLVAMSVNLFAQQVTPFKKNDRVVFLGNSITEAGYYPSYIWLYYMTRFPNMPITIIGAGVGGDRAEEMYKRLDGDVFPNKPTVLVTTFGMNDSGYFEYNQPGAEAFADSKVKASYEWFQKIESRYKDAKQTKMVIMGGSPYDENVKIEGNTPFKNKNTAMRRIVDFQRKAATDNSWEFLDLNVPMSGINESIQKTNPEFTLCGTDRIHPDNGGHMVMAYFFLKAQGFAGKEVASIDIDGSASKVRKTANCTVSDLKATAASISFNYLANALPYPMDTIVRGWNYKYPQSKALEVIPFTEEMNKETLRISGLSGNYRLTIDNEEIGVWSADVFANGLNLATQIKTPQYQQAMKVMFLNEERLEVERRFREYMWIQYTVFYNKGLLFANNREALKVLDQNLDNGWVKGRRDLYTKAMSPEIRDTWQKEMDLITSTIYKINKPLKRKIMLTKVS